ncbi:NAD(P)-binding domain-containing protein [Allobranchiibius sp. CTAmp26]|nr:NAD(P)-binding domain-containing protein [Allobranchiibius sp. CTAmp26]
MNFGTIGAGTVAQAVAGHLVSAGQQVVLSNSRGPDTLGDVTAGLGPLASAGTVEQAAAADMVFLTVMWSDIPAALADLPPWDGRVLVDTTNQFASADPIEVADLGDQTGSDSWPTTPRVPAWSRRSTPGLPATSLRTRATRPAGRSSSTPATTPKPKPASTRCSTMSASLQSTSAGYATGAG